MLSEVSLCDVTRLMPAFVAASLLGVVAWLLAFVYGNYKLPSLRLVLLSYTVAGISVLGAAITSSFVVAVAADGFCNMWSMVVPHIGLLIVMAVAGVNGIAGVFAMLRAYRTWKTRKSSEADAK